MPSMEEDKPARNALACEAGESGGGKLEGEGKRGFRMETYQFSFS